MKDFDVVTGPAPRLKPPVAGEGTHPAAAAQPPSPLEGEVGSARDVRSALARALPGGG